MIPESDIALEDFRNHVIETFKRSLLLFHADCLPHHIVLDSDNFFRSWGEEAKVTDFFGREIRLGGPIAMAYIDGDHSHAQSQRDFQNVDRFLARGGFIVFDDSADDSDWESRLTAADAAARPDYEVIDKTANYCIRKRANSVR